MRINIVRKSDLWHKDWDEAMEVAAQWCANYFKLTHKNVTVDVFLDDFEEGYFGWSCEVDPGKHYEIAVNARQYHEDDLIKTLFHEFTHVKQYLHDGFALDTHEAHYEGYVYSWNKWEEFEDSFYHDSPWEVEARKMEEKLFDKFEEYMNDVS